ncbi:hypothetical protein LJ655_26060 [Paraburkholderia sp. MMS20-SJTN17]|uniref:Uncharacterized protein n=1 Tax=Paraburkholderia translucens TaxID=2886945 RepID=A0ABS8KKJ6_9BURK|nr:hypothetical protein [Paraburkholderia sp. MMS20-SJTN17]MCC8405286.1 hypothetical protein [Paraburkholderia sp. MMS20-SJTN17]
MLEKNGEIILRCALDPLEATARVSEMPLGCLTQLPAVASDIPYSEGNETWREFQEVYDRDSQPEHYAAVGDSPSRGDNEEARLILDQMRDALDKPILRPSDFPR